MLLLKTYNPLQFPGSTPGFAPTHVANTGTTLRLSVASIVTPIDLFTGKQSTSIAGTVSFIIDGALGPVVALSGNGPRLSFSKGINTDTSFSTGVIFKKVNTANNQSLVSNTTGNGYEYRISSVGALNLTLLGVTAFTPGITLADNVPYFLGASFGLSTVVNWVVVRLDTGQRITATNSSGANTPLANNGIYSMGDDQVNGNAYNLKITAAAWFAGALSMSALIQWSDDPWSFWYPRTQQQVMFSGLKPSAAASPVVFRKTLSQIGGRVGTRQPQGWAA